MMAALLGQEAEILTATAVTAPTGEQSLLLHHHSKVFGNMDLLSKSTSYTQEETHAVNATHVFVVPYRVQLPPDAKLSFRGELYEIDYSDDPCNLGIQTEIYLRKESLA